MNPEELAAVLGELLDRVRRIETRLCTLMLHQGMAPLSNNTFEQKEVEDVLV